MRVKALSARQKEQILLEYYRSLDADEVATRYELKACDVITLVLAEAGLLGSPAPGARPISPDRRRLALVAGAVA